MSKVEFHGVWIEESLAGEIGPLYDGGWRASDPEEDFVTEWEDITADEIAQIRQGLSMLEGEELAEKTNSVTRGGAVYSLNCDGTINVWFDEGCEMTINGENNRMLWRLIVCCKADPVAEGWEDGAGHPIGEGTARMLADDDESEASRIVTIRADGKASYKITVTDLVRALNLDIGDQVKVTLRKI